MKIMPVVVFVITLCLLSTPGFAEKAVKGKSGEELFKTHCSVCHPSGGNIINPRKTLRKGDREANSVKTPADIVGKMRNPGPGMTRFDKKTIPDADAKKIADYIVNTFK
ncbi:MAG: c-type cytochrome [Nitrospirae bacterium]|nr:c-type cytochrome [Nitrospirota bacterium]MCL5236471.1 c-type cytochrome [Nitrospirota bacterium]